MFLNFPEMFKGFIRRVTEFHTQQVNQDHRTQLVSSLIHAHQGLSGLSILVGGSLVTVGPIQLKDSVSLFL